jgi:hypothetical protein
MLLLLSVFISVAYCEVTNEIRYNGRLKSYQTPVNGNVSMRFTLYGDSDGITQLWTTGDVAVNVSSGIFTYTLKPVNVDWRKKDIWLELNVGGRVLLPREKVMSQMYAIHSQSAENLSSNSEMNVQVANNKGVIGVNSSGEVYSKSTVAGDTEFYMVPKGGIILWSGAAANIPQGWALCNGDNNTPNLSGRFVLGQGTAYSVVGQTGGEVNHKLTVDEMPNHRHGVDQQFQGKGNDKDGGGVLNKDGTGIYLYTTYAGGDKAHNNMPPYYVLCYIMKK